MVFFGQVNSHFIKKKRASVDWRKMSKNLFEGKGTGVDSVWILALGDETKDKEELAVGWYICGYLDRSKIRRAFAFQIDGGLALVWIGGKSLPLEDMRGEIWRMSFVRSVTFEAAVEEKPAVAKKPHKRTKRGNRNKKTAETMKVEV